MIKEGKFIFSCKNSLRIAMNAEIRAKRLGAKKQKKLFHCSSRRIFTTGYFYRCAPGNIHKWHQVSSEPESCKG